MSDTRRTVIESLPAELWMALFEYFNAHELYRQFSGLNSRIDSVIQSVNGLCLKLDDNNYTYCLEHILPSVRFENIKSLSFYNNSKTIRTTEFFLLYPLNKFTELRSFTFRDWYLPLHNPREIIEQISCLTHLEKLDVCLEHSPGLTGYDYSWEENNTRLMNLIFNSSHNLRTSLKCIVPNMYIGERTLPDIIFLPTNLEYFEVNVIDLEPFLRLIPSLEPRCKTILFKYLEVNGSFAPVSPPSLKVLNRCTKLTVKTNCYFTIKHLEIFLDCFPEVKQLTIDNSSSDETVTAEQLELLLKNKCPKLLKFQYAFYGGRLYDIQHTWHSYTDTFLQSEFCLKHNFQFLKYDREIEVVTLLNVSWCSIDEG